MMTFAFNLCTSLDERLLFLDDDTDGVSSAGRYPLPLASKRLGVAATLLTAVDALVVLLLLPDPSLVSMMTSPVLSALLNVEVTVSPLPKLTWLTGLSKTVGIVATTRVSTMLSRNDCRLTLW